MATEKTGGTRSDRAAQVKVADPKKAMAALDKIRKRDAELLKRLAK